MALSAGDRRRTRRFHGLAHVLGPAVAGAAIILTPARWWPSDQIGTAILAGSAVLLFGALLARLVARPLERRLSTTTAALAVSEGELSRMHRELEVRVGQHTSELIDANRRLRVEVARRALIEIELRQAQKLEAVGNLAAGIAHEINTPVQIPLAIARSLQGLQRVAAMVHAMREFAHHDSHEQVPADLNRAILYTVTIARNEYKYVADVRTELADLPLVTCHIGELNQVILNMLVNAAQAIASAKTEHERDGMVVIRTRAAGASVEVEIEDNGCGIPALAMGRIFHKDTGQGLAIAHAVVVEKHAGKIDVTSRVGFGTTFAITLPIHGREDCEPCLVAAAS